MISKRKRKCTHCKDFFNPDPRNHKRQEYCSKPPCRKASKAASQRRWLSKPENQNYFRGPENVQRVQRWRDAHPGYGRRKSRGSQKPLKDPISEISVQKQEDDDLLQTDALQDLLSAQHVVLIGLISNLTGSALQDDIAQTARRLRQLGEDILHAPTKGGQHGHRSFPPLSPTSAPHPQAVQLGGSPSGP